MTLENAFRLWEGFTYKELVQEDCSCPDWVATVNSLKNESTYLDEQDADPAEAIRRAVERATRQIPALFVWDTKEVKR